MNYIHIVAHDENCAIGQQGKLPWNCPLDLKWFKHFTEGKNLVVGRKTYDDLVRRHQKKSMDRVSPLPGRKLYVISGNLEFTPYSDVVICRDQEHLESMFESHETLIVIGGSGIYKMFKPNLILATEVPFKAECPDAYYPPHFDEMVKSDIHWLSTSKEDIEIHVYVDRSSEHIYHDSIASIQKFQESLRCAF